ncbi:MAG: SRPBCC family protein [Acidimicrobiia bacterium]
MGNHSYRTTASSIAAPSVVFEVLADAERWKNWISTIGRSSYERTGDPAPHGVGAIRVFGPRFGPLSREEVVEYEPPHRFGYIILSGFLPIKDYKATVVLTEKANGTTIDWSGSFSSRVPLMAAFLGKTVSGFAKALAREADRRAGAAN